MSAIFGYIGNNSAKEILFSGLSRLKSGGKDVSGIALKENDAFNTFKIKGSPEELSKKAHRLETASNIGLAQCSREEKFKASSLTAPPSSNELFASVVDGEIENFNSLKQWCAEPFPILTNEDLLLACLSIMNDKNKLKLTENVSNAMSGEPSFAFMSADENAIYCKSGKTKLIIGTSSDGSYVSSELGALVPLCEKYLVLESGETARLTEDRVFVFDTKMKKIKKSFKNIAAQSYTVNNYLSSDEIYCCPLSVKEIFSRFIDFHRINFDFLKLGVRFIDKINKIILIGQGNSKDTALASKSLFETYCAVTSLAYSSSEFLLSNAPVDKNTLVIAISQNGENKTTLKAVNKANEAGAKTVALTKSRHSAIARECSQAVITGNGYENNMAVSTFLSHYLTLCLFSLYLSSKLEIASDLYLGVSLKMVEMLSGIVSAVIKSSPKKEAASSILDKAESIYITSANSDNSICFEAEEIVRNTLKRNVQTVCAYELSEYPCELLRSSAVIALITDKEHFQSEINNIYRIKNRGANVIIITSESIEEELEGFENVISFTDSLSAFNVIPALAGVYKIALSVKENEGKQDVEKTA